MRVRQAIATVGVIAASLASLTACGNATATKAAGSASTSSSASAGPSTSAGGHLDKNGLIQAVTVNQLKAGSAHVSMKMSGSLSMTAQGDVSYRGSTPEMRMTMSMAQLGARRIELRFVGGILYMSIPHISPSGKFLKIDPKDRSNPMAKSFSGMTQQMNPMNSFKAMRSAIDKVTYVGHGTVDGVSTDHYLVAMNSAPMLKAMKQKTVPGVPTRLTYDMWLDDKNRLRQMRFDIAGQQTEMKVSHWGEPVHVTAPPATKVVTSPGMAG